MDEIWKQIKGAKQGFEVSNRGRVRHPNPRKDFNEYGADNGIGYLQTLIYFEDGTRKTMTLHRLVADAFIDNPNCYKEVNHIDGNKRNNCMDNLEWCTRQMNTWHCAKTGLRKCKFSKEQILFIRQSTMRQVDLAEMFGVNQHMISKIKRKVSYAYY